MLAGDARGRARPARGRRRGTASPTSPGLAADPLFAPLAADAAARRASSPPRPPPVPALPVTGGLAPGRGDGNTAWNPATERLEPRFAFAGRARRPGAAARPKAPPPATSCASSGHAAAPPATTAISTTTATAATPASTRPTHPQLSPRRLRRGRPRRRPRLRAERPAAASTGRPSATPRPRSPAARSGAACRATR